MNMHEFALANTQNDLLRTLTRYMMHWIKYVENYEMELKIHSNMKYINFLTHKREFNY